MALSTWSSFSTNPEPDKEIPHDVTAEPITAWRIWKVEKPASLTLDASLANQLADVYDRGGNPFRGLFGARLNAVGVNAPWNSRVTEATCQAHGNAAYNNLILSSVSSSSSSAPPSHKAPDRHCSCGVWALKSEKDLWQTIRSYNKGQVAYGRVLLWGKWFEHAKGYRAQYAQPYDVNVIAGDEETVSDLRAFYGCDVRSVEMPKEVTALGNDEGGYGVGSHHGGLMQFISTNVATSSATATGERTAFKDAAAMFPGRFPILERAAKNTKIAENPTIEWLTGVKDVNGRLTVLKNYTQIFRTPFTTKTTSDALYEHLTDIEKTLEHGRPDADLSCCVRLMGGYRYYLGRDLRKKDKLYLRPLREPVLKVDAWSQSCEWISEVALQVVPG